MPKLIAVPEPLEWLHTAAPDGSLSAREVMRLLQCSRQALQDRIKRGKFPHYDLQRQGLRSGGFPRVYWKVKTVQDWFKQQ